MNLPSKDRDGNSYLSYSEIQTFKKNKEDYYNRYILKTPFIGNAYTDFGRKVGKALEKNDFSLFSSKEVKILKQVTRLDEFERRIKIQYKGFYMIGFLDTNNSSLTRIIDYKTGGIRKEFQYQEKDYNQTQIYALGIRQEKGIKVKDASIEFIRREGNAFKGDKLHVKNEQPIVIYQDLSEERLKHVYSDVLKTAKEIEKFYKETINESK